ncbi:prolipoprotein diacylglyceryl transferase, partial [Vibrio fluvialis]|nr:prolipoprotein diacylglyceryl transferase [Vibrio fluvialis]
LSTPMIIAGVLLMVWAYKRGRYQDSVAAK